MTRRKYGQAHAQKKPGALSPSHRALSLMAARSEPRTAKPLIAWIHCNVRATGKSSVGKKKKCPDFAALTCLKLSLCHALAAYLVAAHTKA